MLSGHSVNVKESRSTETSTTKEDNFYYISQHSQLLQHQTHNKIMYVVLTMCQSWNLSCQRMSQVPKLVAQFKSGLCRSK